MADLESIADSELTDASALADLEPEVSITELADTCGVSRPTIYNYLEATGIQSERRGKRAYISREDAEAIIIIANAMKAAVQSGDQKSVYQLIQELRSQGKSIPIRADFEDSSTTRKETYTRKPTPFTDQEDDFSTSSESVSTFMARALPTFNNGLSSIGEGVISLSRGVYNLVETINTLPDTLVKRLGPSPGKRLREKYEFLMMAAEHDLLIKTSELAEVLGVSTGTLSSQKVAKRDGFIFTKLGKENRSGRESLWRVQKIATNALKELDSSDE